MFLFIFNIYTFTHLFIGVYVCMGFMYMLYCTLCKTANLISFLHHVGSENQTQLTSLDS